MNEEEIIKYFKEVISWYRENTPDRVYALNNKDIEMLQGLLDLYNKEKSKTKLDITEKELEEAHKYFMNYTFLGDITAKHIMTILNAYDKEKEKNKELEEGNKLQRQQLNSAFDNGFIHKDKIREKIEELNERKMDIVTSTIYSRDEKVKILKNDQIKIDILQQLLNKRIRQINKKIEEE